MVAALSLVIAGATLGFLIWNKSPAKIYMGDAGALFLGIIILQQILLKLKKS
jgi:UDP-GlcNAc:undecaprenyl-phosphate GlcNAc-1-phosphate transferase